MPSRPPHVEALKIWLAEVEADLRELDRLGSEYEAHGHAIREQLTAVAAEVRRRRGVEQLLVETIELARRVGAAKDAQLTDCAQRLWEEMSLEGPQVSLVEAVEPLVAAAEKRRTVLATERGKKSRKLVAEMEPRRPEFERLRQSVRSDRRAAWLLAKQSGGDGEATRRLADRIRKYFGRS